MAKRDYVVLQDAEENGSVLIRAGVGGWWPPPERVWLVHQVDNLRAAWLGTYEDMVRIPFVPEVEVVATPFLRVRWSELSDAEVEAMEHVARGALYVPAEPGSMLRAVPGCRACQMGGGACHNHREADRG